MKPPSPYNEPVRSYAPGTPERESLRRRLDAMASETVEIPMVIGGEERRTGSTFPAVMPHDHGHVLGTVHQGGAADVADAVEAAARAWPDWSSATWEQRAAVFLRAADLLAGPWRDTLNAATMLGQSKTAQQAEIDAACELCDFLRYNVDYMCRIQGEQPVSPPGAWNRLDYRPLEGFVLAVTPFNFTSIAGNLPTSAALMGNTVVWKPSQTATLSAHHLMLLLRAAGLPDGVINLVQGDPASTVAAALADARLAGVHFTGSTAVFRDVWRQVGERIDRYRNYPRLVGETGGKDFILAHASAEVPALATAILRGAFEYQGQKCSAASRVYVPRSLWPEVRERLGDEVPGIAMGDVRDFSNFMGAVIDRRSFERQRAAIDEARGAGYEILAGGDTDGRTGWFVRPTVVVADDPDARLMRDELFGPVVTVHVYADGGFEDALVLIDRTSPYGLTGGIFANDRAAVQAAETRLRYSAGNFYINDKPTGAVVGQQPFGGARASGTDDKAGSLWNLTRWVSPRAIKETSDPPREYRHPHQG